MSTETGLYEQVTVPEAVEAFAEPARRAIYDVIALRRDVRHFRPDQPVADDVLDRVLAAAHLAPSVGFSQPWGFIVVRDREVRERIRQSFLRCREAEAVRFPPERREAYLAHRLEGILDSSLNLCVAVDLRSRGEAILGTTAQPEAVRASACCAVENLWLAARAEGVGVGWVSIVEPAVLRAELALPAGVEPIAYLCLGYPRAFRSRPMLEETGWRARRPLSEVVHPHDRWNDVDPLSPALAAPRGESGPHEVAPFLEAARRAAVAHQATLTKPAGSLGRLEEIAAWYAGVRGAFPPPPVLRAVLALFAADHGVVVEGVSAYGSQVTAAMLANVMSGGAATNAIAGEAGVEILLTDVGIAGDLSATPTQPVVGVKSRRVRSATRNLRREAAMTRVEVERALEVGAEVARSAARSGADVIGLGEIGIGNTTAAAALTSVFARARPADVVGRGTGIGDDVLARKIAVVEDALNLHRPDPIDPIGVLAAVGGLEIAALAGCALEAARHRLAVVLDGFVTNAAALAATRIDPGVRAYLLASHASPEPGASIALGELGLVPLLDLGMRLGEGTGASLAIALLRTAVTAQLSMATFATAGIVGRAGASASGAEGPSRVTQSAGGAEGPRRVIQKKAP
jgi:nicotinate-nucleotide--dimethylbenzimidazole phosphoribosyltransferase